ncbi:hypothetical protein [Skermanella pratensis]|uniref:hypothetical protein n=1 Tax=Skermanella pratensis TaxID=2233999 RepID=UPI001301376A|nr:hypothetical protein [Skermanella pratensis]
MRVLEVANQVAAIPGGIGALLRREGLYSSALTNGCRQRVGKLDLRKRGQTPAPENPLAAELARRVLS